MADPFRSPDVASQLFARSHTSAHNVRCTREMLVVNTCTDTLAHLHTFAEAMYHCASRQATYGGVFFLIEDLPLRRILSTEAHFIF